MVFFLSSDGVFYALDARTGSEKWTFKTEGEKFHDTWDYFLSSPTINNGIVYFGSGDGNLYALKSNSGKFMWKFKTGGIVHASPAFADDAIFIGSFDGYFYCINSNGTLRWKFDTIGETYFKLGEVQFNATISGNTVYFCSRDFNVYALDIKDGSGKWVYHQTGSWTSVPSIYKNKLIVTMSDSYSVLVFDAVSGNKLFDSVIPLNVFSSAAINEDKAYFGSMDGAIYRLDLESGKTSKIFQTESSKKNYHVFFSEENKLKQEIIEKYYNDVTPLFQEYLKLGSILSTVWIDNGIIYTSSTDGYIYALE